MKKILLCFLILLTLSGCFKRVQYHWNEGLYYAEYHKFALNRYAKEETTYEIEEAIIEVATIDAQEYYDSGGLNTVKSYLPDDNGTYYFSLNLKIKFKDYSYWDVELHDQKERMENPDSYIFLIKIDNEEINCSIPMKFMLEDEEFSITPTGATCWINHKSYECFFQLVFKKESKWKWNW